MILAIDQGTTGTTVIIVSPDGDIISRASSEVEQTYPHPGWVSQNAEKIWESTQNVIGTALGNTAISPHEISGIGITNQRETTVIWDRKTGEPVYDAIVWQCRRTMNLCLEFQKGGLTNMVAEKTGLVIDPYFSATKIVWLLQNVPALRDRAKKGEVCFGTVDAFLLYKLTGGAHHATDYTNASRTMCFNIHTLNWDSDLLTAFDIPQAILPEVRPSRSDFGNTVETNCPLPSGIPIRGIAGDQQAALFGQGGISKGDIKNTYGTGCFTLCHTGKTAVHSHHGLLTTLALDPKGNPAYALEGSIFSAGSAIQWLRDGLGILKTAADTESLSISVPDTGSVYFVPAFNGLGAPHWESKARGTLVGISLGTTHAHIARAVLESIAYQTADLIKAMAADAGKPIKKLRVDGGASANNFLMQFQSNILNVPVIRPRHIETTALGAAMLAGFSIGLWEDPSTLEILNPPERIFEPVMTTDQRTSLLRTWRQAVQTSLYHANLDHE